MAGIYNGHLLEFPQIRVDCFTSPTPSRPFLLPDHDAFFSSNQPSSQSSSSVGVIARTPAPNARLYLLTHVHTDHLIGLSSSFTGKIVCTPDTKRMLLRLEAENERELIHNGLKETRRLKYEGLKERRIGDRVVDMIEAIPYGHPTDFEIGYENGEPAMVTITLLDANHCPGSAMFLIRSKDKAVLHTGDIRADSAFLASLRDNPALSEFIDRGPASTGNAWGKRVLDRVYLDTSAVLGTGDMPDRGPVLDELVRQMAMYPKDTVFFLNVWCFGWEHVAKAVARHFGSPIHVDRYKRAIYAAVKTDPFLLACTTHDPTITRFHACERRFKCEQCRSFDKQGRRTWNADKLIVHVNMVEVKTAAWGVEQKAFRERLEQAGRGEGLWPFNIDCPIARHSPLPELQALVKLLRPRSVSPNCVVPQLKGLDYFLLPGFMQDALQLEGFQAMVAERDAWFRSTSCTIRGGTGVLDGLKRQQEMGANLLALIEEGGGSTYDDYIPDGSRARGAPLTPSTFAVKMVSKNFATVMGRGRSAHASDQAMRSGAIGLLPAGVMDLIAKHYESSVSAGTAGGAKGNTSTFVKNDDPGSGIFTDLTDLPVTTTGYASDTDDEIAEGSRKRRRRLVDYKKRQMKVSKAMLARAKHHKTPSTEVKVERISSEGTEMKPDYLDSMTAHQAKGDWVAGRNHSRDSPNTEAIQPKREYDSDSSSKKRSRHGFSASGSTTRAQGRFLVDQAHLAALFAVGEDRPGSL